MVFSVNIHKTSEKEALVAFEVATPDAIETHFVKVSIE